MKLNVRTANTHNQVRRGGLFVAQWDERENIILLTECFKHMMVILVL